MIVEGTRVTYAGDTDPFQEVGALGRVVALSGDAAHVQWTTGPKTGSIDLVETYELLPARTTLAFEATTVTAAFDDALEMAAAPSLQVRAVYDEAGPEGLVAALDEAGHLPALAEYVEDALGRLGAQLRGDAHLSGILASLEPDEAESVVSRLASMLVADRTEESD
jgi:hypothetical protein